MNHGLFLAPKCCAAWKVPSPLPKSTETLLEPKFATAKSRLPSSLKAPTATEEGALPAVTFRAGWKLPSPLPKSTDTLLASSVGDGEILRPVAIEVAHRNGLRPSTRIKIKTGDEPYILRLDFGGDQNIACRQHCTEQRPHFVRG